VKVEIDASVVLNYNTLKSESEEGSKTVARCHGGAITV
jgi:hypothetical protein